MTRIDADRAVDLLALAVVVSVAVAAGPVTWRLTGHDDGRRAVATVATAAPAATVDLAPLKAFAPFGARVVAGGVAGDPSALGLQLRGILLARPASASVALIAAGGGPAKGFAVGDVLPGGAILDAVEFDLVVLRVGGRLVTLALPVRSGAPPHPLAAAPPVPGAPAVPARSIPAAASLNPIENYRARAGDPFTLLGSLGATPGPDGYRVGPQPSDDLRRAGLMPGDIIEKVNGETVGDPARDRRLFDDAVVAGRVRVEVVRDGRPVALSFPLH